MRRKENEDDDEVEEEEEEKKKKACLDRSPNVRFRCQIIFLFFIYHSYFSSLALFIR